MLIADTEVIAMTRSVVIVQPNDMTKQGFFNSYFHFLTNLDCLKSMNVLNKVCFFTLASPCFSYVREAIQNRNLEGH